MTNLTEAKAGAAEIVRAFDAKEAASSGRRYDDALSEFDDMLSEYAVDVARALLALTSGTDEERVCRLVAAWSGGLHGTRGELEAHIAAFAAAVRAEEREAWWQFVLWLNGENGDFPEREAGQGAYYWRREMMKRATAIRERGNG